jgi:Arc/MetJ family transcription regulator
MCIKIYFIHTNPGDTMRTNIVIDDELMNEAIRLSNLKTKKEVVSQALKLLVQVKRQEKIRAWRGKLAWGEDLAETRTDK